MLSIHSANISDIPLIRELAYAIWPHAYNTILSVGQLHYMLEWMYSENALASQMKEGQQFYLAYEGEKAVGFAAVGPYDTHTYKLHKIYLLSQMQGKGAGRQLLQFLIDKVKENGASRLLLNVNRQNPAFYFYKKMGFEIKEEVNVDIGEGYFMNDYVMQLHL